MALVIFYVVCGICDSVCNDAVVRSSSVVFLIRELKSMIIEFIRYGYIDICIESRCRGKPDLIVFSLIRIAKDTFSP